MKYAKGTDSSSCHGCFSAGYMAGGNVAVGSLSYNPAVSERQRRFMGAELARKRAGKKTRTGMSEEKLEEFARKR